MVIIDSNVKTMMDELSIIMEATFLPFHQNMESRIGTIFKQAQTAADLKNQYAYQVELIKLKFIAKHLREVKNYDYELFAHFKKELIEKQKSSDNYHGDRFELYTAASLIRNSIPFKKHETPDFIIQHENINFGIECTELHFSTPPGERNLPRCLKKIGRSIREKSRKKYIDSENRTQINNNILFIETTNLLYEMWTNNDLDPLKIREKYLNTLNNQTTFQSIINFTLGTDNKGNWLYCYNRYDHRSINKQTENILNQYYPINSEKPQLFDFVNHA